MDLNSSSDEEEDTPVAAPPQAAPAQAPSDQTGGATTESMDVDEANEVLEVEVEAVWEDEEEEELDPRTLGVPGLRTLEPGDHVEVLWANGAFSPPCPAPQHAPDLRHLGCTTCAQAGRGGESRSACSRCGHAGPSSSTASRITTARRLPPPSLPHSMDPERSHNSRATASPKGGRGPAHAPGTASSRGGGRGGRAVRPAVPEHAEK